VDVNVGDNDVKDITFIQTGYSMPYDSTHSFDVVVKKGKGGSVEKKKILKGDNQQLCFQSRGSYSIQPDSCYKFETEKFSFQTGQAERTTLHFKPTHCKVEGRVSLKDDS
jgi:hypothetical protein